jgi:hypothetical protein
MVRTLLAEVNGKKTLKSTASSFDSLFASADKGSDNDADAADSWDEDEADDILKAVANG